MLKHRYIFTTLTEMSDLPHLCKLWKTRLFSPTDTMVTYDSDTDRALIRKRYMSIRACLHVPSSSLRRVRHCVYVRSTEKMGSVCNLPVKWAISIGTMLNCDGDGHGHGDGDGTCKQALSLTSGFHGVLQHKSDVRGRTICVEFDSQNPTLRLEI